MARQRSESGLLCSAEQDRSRLDMLTRQIWERKGQVGRSLYEIGTRLIHIAEAGLWRAGGHRTFEDYLAEDVQFSRSTAYRLMRIARAFDARTVAQHGIEKLDLAVRYLNVARARGAPRDTTSTDPMQTPVRVRDARGQYRARPLCDASADEIRTALAELRSDPSRRPQPTRVPPGLREQVRSLEATLPSAPEGSHRGHRIRLRRARDGRVSATFHAIPLDDLAAFIHALEHFVKSSS